MKKVIAAVLAILCVAMGIVLYLIGRKEDRTAPEIIFSNDEIQYEQGEDLAKLLEGVKAIDDVDGDVSDTLVVESVIPMENGTTATILYYAKDKSNNVAKMSRIVAYMPSGGILWQVETESGNEEEQETETETEENLPPGSPRMTLTTDKVTIKQGESYNLLEYVKEITDDKDGPDWLYYQIQISGKNDIAGPGEYELYYFVYDREGNQSNRAKLTFIVK